MKKKITAILTICMLAVTMTACGDSGAAEETTAAPANTAASEDNSADDTADAEEDAAAEEDTADEEADASSDEFTLLDVSADMIDVGVYAVDDEQTELVFSMFTAPSGTPMASLFVYCADGTGDVICGSYAAETETDEDGVNWTKLDVSDVYTEQDFTIGFAETDDGQVYILNTAGEVYEGQYLSADDTVVYMGTAVGLLS